MRFLADENFPRLAIEALRELGHDVASVWEDARGSDDGVVLDRAQHEKRVIVTFDKDFGELAFRHHLSADCGVVLFRLGAAQPAVMAHRVCNVLQSQPSWQGLFASVDEERIRIRTLPGC